MPPIKNISKCLVEDCSRLHHSKGICRIHYNRLRKTGRLDTLPKHPKDKLLSYSIKNKETGCWEWRRKNTNGYGFIWIKGKVYQAHRMSWMTFNNKEIPKDKQINHKCNNRICINPDHLYLGTAKENSRDMFLAGTIVRGSKCKMAKLSEGKVIKIKELINQRKRSCDLADQFNVARSTIWGIKSGKTWKHVT